MILYIAYALMNGEIRVNGSDDPDRFRDIVEDMRSMGAENIDTINLEV